MCAWQRREAKRWCGEFLFSIIIESIEFSEIKAYLWTAIQEALDKRLELFCISAKRLSKAS